MSAAFAASPLRGRATGSIRAFLRWWRAGLLAWLPAALRQAVFAADARLWLQPGDTGVRLQHQHAGQLRELAQLPMPLPAGARDLARLLQERAQRLPRWLLLPAGLGLRRGLVLPAAAADRLREVLGFELERQTPFQAADVLHDGRILATRDDGQLDVELVVLPRGRLDAALADIGLVPADIDGLDLADVDGVPLGVNLLAASRSGSRRGPARTMQWAAAGVALVFIALAMAQLLHNRRALADRLRSDIAARELPARQASQERQRLVDLAEGARYLQQQRRQHPPLVEVMDGLATRIPDGTWLEKLSLDGGQLTLIGLSNQAAALVGLLQDAPQWTAPALSGALQQDPRTRMDRFTMVMQLAGPGAGPAASATAAGGADAPR